MSLILSKKSCLKLLYQKSIPILSVCHISDTANVSAFKTSKSDPAEHTLSDVGLVYGAANNLFLDVLFKGTSSFPKSFIEECKTFGEVPILIRKPALEIINYLKNSNYENPINKYVLYGKSGNGVSTTLYHIIHYAYTSGWLIVHVPRVLLWAYSKTEVCESDSMPGYVDLPTLGSAWLNHFKSQNFRVINKLNLKLQNDYQWNSQESSLAGESLLNMLDYGISRAKTSNLIISHLLNEVKLLSKKGDVRTLIAIDGYNSIFHPVERCRHPKFKFRSPSKISFVTAFKNVVVADWHNGAAVVTCESSRKNRNEYYPLMQLTREGFEILDPFVPVEVPYLTRKEIYSMLAYYKSQKWLPNSEADLQLLYLSAGNFLSLRRLCGPL